MTESKPTQNRIIRPQPVPAAVALGHSYASQAPYQLTTRPKVNQVTQSSVATTNVSPAMITHSSQTTAGTTQIQVSLPLVGSNKEPLTVVPRYTFSPKSNSTSQSSIRTPVHPSHSSTDKISVAVTTTTAETLVKANVKNVGTQRVNYVKQVSATIAKSIISGSPNPSIVQAPIKKDSEPGKPRHFLVAAGLRQPLKPSHQPVAKANVPIEMPRVVPRSAPVHSSSWVCNQQDSIKPIIPSPSSIRMKIPFQNATAHDLAKKHTISQQAKTTISITPSAHVPSREAGLRSTTLPVAPISAGNKPIYQVLTPNIQSVQGDAAKKIPMIVSQAITLPVSNPPNSTTGFIPPSSVLSSGQITVMTCGAGITYVPAPTPPNGSSNPIPIAKVYPQQQSTSRTSVVSTSSGRLSVPVISSVNASSSQRTTAALIQVGPTKSTSTSSIVTTQTTIMSSIPTAITKNVSNSGIGPVLCWQTLSQPIVPASTSTSNLRPSLSLTSAPVQQSLPIPGTIRVQPHTGNVLVNVQGGSGTAPVLQVAESRSMNSTHNSTNQPAIGPGTPTMSPKPAILRRPRPEGFTALKKLSFPTAPPSFASQRRDLHPQANDRRPAPYTLTRPKVNENTKPNIPVVIQHGEKSETKPVLENQAFPKQLSASNSVTSLKLVNSVKPPPTFSNSAKDGGGQSYSIRPVADLKVKVESGSSNRLETVKSEPASASQMLQFHHQSMHTYAAESPQNVQQRVISQASGHYAQTHTIFTKPGPHSIYPSPQTTRPKPAQVIKAGANTISNPLSQVDSNVRQSSHAVNSFPQHRTGAFTSDRSPSAFDYVKKEQSRMKPMSGLEQGKQLGGSTIIQNHGITNHLISPAKSWSNAGNLDPSAGLSPRKRPRKQTHVVSEDQPVVMEDEESTDDADECEDEPMPDVAPIHPSVFTTPSTKLPGHKPLTSHRQIKSEPVQNKKVAVKEENIHKSLHVKSDMTSSESKPVSEYTDPDGVRYVLSRKRPAVSVLNRLKHNSRSVANHFMHYSDVRVKDKKTTIADLASDKSRLKGVKVARLALQLHDMVQCEKDVWSRMQGIHDGLIKYKTTLVGDQTFESNLASPSPGTPSALSNSFRKATPRSSRSSSLSAVNENGAMQSPSTPLDRKVHKVKDEILLIEELAQANLQRCRVVSDQLTDTKTMLLKSVDHRQLVADILESPANQKNQPQTQTNSQTTKRLPKKKNNS